MCRLACNQHDCYHEVFTKLHNANTLGITVVIELGKRHTYVEQWDEPLTTTATKVASDGQTRLIHLPIRARRSGLRLSLTAVSMNGRTVAAAKTADTCSS